MHQQSTPQVHPFDGIYEKLKRADENILNLKGEMDLFFRDCKYPTIPHPRDRKAWQEAIDYHRSLAVPIRFSVLIGEIVHHLRSCLDHVVWIFSNDEARKRPANVAFPVIATFPPTEKELARIDTNVKGITNPRVEKMIRDLQPYKAGADAGNDALAFVHDMDRFDKHREVQLSASGPSADITFPPGTPVAIIRLANAYTQGEPLTREQLAMVGREINKNHQVTPNIAFRQFGKWKTQPVIPSLTQVASLIRKTIDDFAAEL